MSFESIIIINLIFYLAGFVLMLSLNNSILGEIAGWSSIFINILGLIIALSFLMNFADAMLIYYPWIKVGKNEINFELLLNSQTVFMYSLVQGVSLFVQIFSIKYLKNDPGLPRYFAFINLFLFAMLGLVLAGNLFQMYIFWELVGFCSYLLIGYWYENPKANHASFKAFLMNRVGDAFLLAGILFIYLSCHTLSFDVLSHFKSFQIIPGINLDSQQLQTLSILLVFVGVMTKSAQFPFLTWLPDAMQGPTPASALIHAATMVVAGVFLLARISNLINAEVGFVIALVGAFTSVIGGFSAIFQFDIKKVLAYSTISQIGLMITGIGVGAVGPTLFHLTTHGFFKAGLFLCAGAVIDFCHHEQDMRKMGDLKSKMPLIYFSYVICAAALIGLPFTSGYLSKESLLTAILNYGMPENLLTYKIIIPILIGISMFLTTFYIVRQGVLVFFERFESPIEKIIEGARKNIAFIINGITNIVTADNEKNSEEAWFIRFFRKIGEYQIATLFLSSGAFWWMYTANPFNVTDNWFNFSFPIKNELHYFWLPYAAISISLVALVIAFNYARAEISNFSNNVIMEGFYEKLFKLGYHHFYLDKAIVNSVMYIMIGRKPKDDMNLLFSETPNESYSTKGILKYFDYTEKHILDEIVNFISKAFLEISSAIKWFEVSIIDFIVFSITSKIAWLGNQFRRLQNGNIQNYVLTLLTFLLLIIIIKLIN